MFLESAGREDAIASDTEGAVGLTQILAETGQNLLGMHVDVPREPAAHAPDRARGRAGPQRAGRGARGASAGPSTSATTPSRRSRAPRAT